MTELVHPESLHSGQFRYPSGWCWNDPRHGEHFRRCTWCGSAHPDDLAAEPQWRAEWADRKYGWPHKFYVEIPNRNPEALFAVGSRSAKGTAVDEPMGNGWVRVADLTAEQRSILQRDRMGSDYTTHVLFGTRPHHHAKFYTVHLADLAVSPQTKHAIEQRSGLHFEFRDGRVSWSPAQAPTH